MKSAYRKDYHKKKRLKVVIGISIVVLMAGIALYFGINSTSKQPGIEVEIIQNEKITDYERRKTETILYWIKIINTEQFMNNLNQKWKKIRG